jgi:NAD(P)-dependent dehydrogenase (short-subunit alcohol dehydrogenase family)
MFSLAGKGALVTGATGGIGEAVARVLHQAGANVAISGTKVDRLEALAADLKERVHIVPCNLSDRAAVQKLAGEAEAKVGTLDILVNNAGMTKDNLFMRMKDEEWDQVIAVDLTSAFMLSRAAVRNMPPVGPDRQHHLDFRYHRQPGSGQLCRGQGGHDRHDQVPGARGCLPRHHRQLHRPRLHQDGHDGRS